MAGFMPRDESGARTALADRFETERSRLHGIAYRLLGSPSEAEDAVQEAWLRLSGVDADGIENLTAWLTTVVSRICLDMLRSRRARPEEPVGHGAGAPQAAGAAGAAAAAEQRSPEDEAVLIDSVGRALLVVLNALGPAERVAFVLHDMFAVPFHEIAVILDRSQVAAKQLASRARRRVKGTPAVGAAELARHRRVVEAFLTAARGGDIAELLAVLAPDVVRHVDPAALRPGAAAVLRGADEVARETVLLAANARYAALALVDGAVGLVVAPHGRLRFALSVTVGDTTEGERVTSYTVHAHANRQPNCLLRELRIAVLPEALVG